MQNKNTRNLSPRRTKIISVNKLKFPFNVFRQKYNSEMAPQPRGPTEAAKHVAVTTNGDVASKCPFADKDYPPMAPIPASRKRLPRMSTGKLTSPEKVTAFIRPDLPSRCTWMPNMDSKASPHIPYER
jgi:hypothetical protein